MKPVRNKFLLLNSVFVAALLLLVVNDHILKQAFGNGWTGKLSDIAGIIFLPLLLAFLFPKIRYHALWLSAGFFAFWKSPFSQPFIDAYNQMALIPISRVVDYTDLLVLPLLVIPLALFRNLDHWKGLHLKKLPVALVLVPAVAALMATAPPPSHYYTQSGGNLRCYGCSIMVPYSQPEVLEKLRQKGILFDHAEPVDTNELRGDSHLKQQQLTYYRKNLWLIGKDTLRNLDLTMRAVKENQTEIYFNGMQVSQDISTQKLENQLRKYYKSLLFAELKNRLDR